MLTSHRTVTNYVEGHDSTYDVYQWQQHDNSIRNKKVPTLFGVLNH